MDYHIFIPTSNLWIHTCACVCTYIKGNPNSCNLHLLQEDLWSHVRCGSHAWEADLHFFALQKLFWNMMVPQLKLWTNSTRKAVPASPVIELAGLEVSGSLASTFLFSSFSSLLFGQRTYASFTRKLCLLVHFCNASSSYYCAFAWLFRQAHSHAQ